MALEISDDYVTFTASQWADPIADIASKWLEQSQRRPDVHHLTPGDRGRSHAIILLLAVMLESYSQRAAVDMDLGKNVAEELFEVGTWWGSVNYPKRDDVLDVIALRNVLAHNHLYSYSINGDAETIPTFTRISRFNNTFTARVVEGKLTHSGMSCVPELIGPHEVLQVSRIVKNALIFLPTLSTHIGSVAFTFARRDGFSNLWEGIELAASSANKRLEPPRNA